MEMLNVMMDVSMFCITLIMTIIVLVGTAAFFIGVFYLCRSYYRAPDKQLWWEEVKRRIYI